MVTDTYAHGFDADRKLIAQEMNSGFFSKVGEGKIENVDNEATLSMLRTLIKNRPELLEELLKETVK